MDRREPPAAPGAQPAAPGAHPAEARPHPVGAEAHPVGPPGRTRLRAARSIRARVTAGALLVLALALGLGSAVAVQVLDRSLTQGVATTLDQDLETVSDRLEADPSALEDLDDDLLVQLGGSRPVREDADLPADASLPVVPEDRTERVVIDGEPYLAASEETDAGTLTVARSLEQVQEATRTARLLLLVAVPLVLLLIGAVLWVVTGRALAPVERLRRQVDAIDPADPAQRVDAGDDELGALAATMNRLLERIQQAQVLQRRFVSDASHELRSPLATMRQHAELARDHPEATSLEALGAVVRDEGARMQELVESLLLLARLDEGQDRPMAEVDLDDLALAEASRLRGLGLRVDARGIGPGRVHGDASTLARALRNLTDNAARHAAGTVALRVATRGGRVHVEVEDDGSGIPPGQRELVFERFARLDEGRARDAGGSGLGLAIVRRIARAHGGDVRADQGTLGGALMVLDLPGADPEA